MKLTKKELKKLILESTKEVIGRLSEGRKSDLSPEERRIHHNEYRRNRYANDPEYRQRILNRERQRIENSPKLQRKKDEYFNKIQTKTYGIDTPEKLAKHYALQDIKHEMDNNLEQGTVSKTIATLQKEEYLIKSRIEKSKQMILKRQEQIAAERDKNHFSKAADYENSLGILKDQLIELEDKLYEISRQIRTRRSIQDKRLDNKEILQQLKDTNVESYD